MDGDCLLSGARALSELTDCVPVHHPSFTQRNLCANRRRPLDSLIPLHDSGSSVTVALGRQFQVGCSNCGYTGRQPMMTSAARSWATALENEPLSTAVEL